MDRFHFQISHLVISIAMLTSFFLRPSPHFAPIVGEMPGNERDNLATLIAFGKDPLDIRVDTIHDWKLVAAIIKGSHHRQIRVLADHDSPELQALVGRKNLHVRLSAADKREQFGAEKLAQSFVLKISKGWYEVWAGTLIWTKKAFGPKTEFSGGSGAAQGETMARDAQTFDHDFSAASAVK